MLLLALVLLSGAAAQTLTDVAVESNGQSSGPTSNVTFTSVFPELPAFASVTTGMPGEMQLGYHSLSGVDPLAVCNGVPAAQPPPSCAADSGVQTGRPPAFTTLPGRGLARCSGALALAAPRHAA